MAFSPQSHRDHGESQSKIVEISNLDKENEISGIIVDCAFKVHTSIGPGLLEATYQECMEKEFFKRKINFKSQITMPIYYDGDLLKTPYKPDFLIEDKIIVELKSVEKLLPVHEAQALSYLKLSEHRVALLINFSSPLIKNGIKRFVI